ncbi:MAG: NitT/TauT family transport system ATP-binding protein [Cellvibrionaceae bacterium]|jgi:NitT/TauT family transport system ATP-binding protein
MNGDLALAGVTKSFSCGKRSKTVLESLSITLQAGQFVAFVGASGCGKSTLLRLIAGLDPVDHGEILLNNQAVKTPGTDRAMVFQDYSLYPWLTVIENIRFCRELKAHQKNQSESAGIAAVDRSYALLELMGLDTVAKQYPNQLSGGMQQRVAIARAIMAGPQWLLMDEPFGALDAQTREVMHELILYLHSHENMGIIFVTHDVEEALYLADQIVIMSPNPGKIDQVVTSPLPQSSDRRMDMKHGPDFISAKRQILQRIRDTSDIQSSMDLLGRIRQHPTKY